MDTEFVALLLIGAAAGGFINGLAGFGTSLFALGWWLQIMPPVQAVALVLALSVASGLQGAFVVRHAVQSARLLRFLLPGCIGIPIGLQLLDVVDAEALKLIIASFLLAYGAFFLFRRDLPNLTSPTRVLDATIGFLGGILGAIAGLSGPLPTMWLAMRDWPRHETRAVLQPYNISILGISAVLLAIGGAYTRDVLIALLIALPATMLAAQIGLWVFGKLEDSQFRRLLIGLMTVSGMILLARSLF
ncbi:MAG: sulfite exporter TauE/SafE family protein [Pseudomonadota bacterium]